MSRFGLVSSYVLNSLGLGLSTMSLVSIPATFITDTIKQAVIESIKDREKNARDKFSVMLFGLADRKQDF